MQNMLHLRYKNNSAEFFFFKQGPPNYVSFRNNKTWQCNSQKYSNVFVQLVSILSVVPFLLLIVETNHFVGSLFTKFSITQSLLALTGNNLIIPFRSPQLLRTQQTNKNKVLFHSCPTLNFTLCFQVSPFLRAQPIRKLHPWASRRFHTATTRKNLTDAQTHSNLMFTF